MAFQYSLSINTKLLTNTYQVLDDLAPACLSRFASYTSSCLPCCSHSGLPLLPVPQICNFSLQVLCYFLPRMLFSQALSVVGSFIPSRSHINIISSKNLFPKPPSGSRLPTSCYHLVCLLLWHMSQLIIILCVYTFIVYHTNQNISCL